MTQHKLEERLLALEQEVSLLRSEIERLKAPKDWRSVVGMFSADDEVMKRIDAAGRKIREADRRRTRPKAPKRTRKVHS